MNKLVLILMLAVTVEALIEYLKSIVKGFLSCEWKTAVTQLLAIVFAVSVCMMTDADLYALLGITFSCPIFGIILTGVFASRGANYVSDFIKRLQTMGGSGNG